MRTALLRSCARFLARRRVLLFMVLVCSVAFLVGALLGFAPAQQQEAYAQSSSTTTEQPNIIFVLTDDLDYASAFKMPEIRSRLIEKAPP